MSTPRPTPAVMRGRTDPARSVRPVDYTSWRPSPAAAGEQGAGGAEPASSSSGGQVPGGAHRPSPPAGGPRPKGARTTPPASSGGQPPADRRAPGGTPKPGPGPRSVPSAGADRTETAGNADGTTTPQLTVDPQLARFVERLRAGMAPETGTPENAFYTVDSATTEPSALHVPAEGVHAQGVWDVSEQALRAVVAQPEDTWTADLGRTDYYVRGQLCVQVMRAEHRVVGIYRSGWAIARRPDETWADTADSLERTGAKPGGGGTRYPTNRRELLERLRGAGFEVTTSGPTHGKITHPDAPGRFLPFSSTPSSQRYGRHVVTAVKRVFGIDVR